MKTSRVSLCIYFLLFLSLSCTKDENGFLETIGILNIEIPILEGEITDGQVITLEPLPKFRPYVLRGYFRIKDGGKLIIKPGVIIEAEGHGELVDVIVVEQGGILEAKGELNNPILFTCTKKEAGSWGGLVLLGRAPINTNGIPQIDETLGNYGGNNINDNSGILNYVVVEYAGLRKSDIAEFNGISLFGIGKGTSIDNVYIREVDDDGIEMFGGTVDITHILVKNCRDDLFDWTEGWQGRGQFWIGHICNFNKEKAEESGGLEAESFNRDIGVITTNNSLESKVKLYNVSIVGEPEKTDWFGIRIKSGSLKLYNSIILNYELGAIQIDTCLTPGEIKFSGMLIYDAKNPQSPKKFIKDCSLYQTLFGCTVVPTYPVEEISDCRNPNYLLQNTYSIPPYSSNIVDPSIEESATLDQGFFTRVLVYGGDDGTNWTSWTNRFN